LNKIGFLINKVTQYLASCLRAAGCKSPQDIPGISLALQGYNYGGGYINWAKAKGGYTPANAKAFSQMKSRQLGWTSYGDINYVADVLRYYSTNAMPNDGCFTSPLAAGTYHISSGYGFRWGKLHKGIDFAAPEGI
jgi:murein DD-endopeptidase MepM/ murein hydrolase activator NlpD